MGIIMREKSRCVFRRGEQLLHMRAQLNNSRCGSRQARKSRAGYGRQRDGPPGLIPCDKGTRICNCVLYLLQVNPYELMPAILGFSETQAAITASGDHNGHRRNVSR